MTHHLCDTSSRNRYIDEQVALAVDHVYHTARSDRTSSVIGRLSFHDAVTNRCLDTAKLVHIRGIRSIEETTADQNQTPLLRAAASGGNAELVEYFLSIGASVKAVDSDGRSAIMYAAMTLDVESVRVLLRAASSLSLEDKNGHRAMHFVVMGKNNNKEKEEEEQVVDIIRLMLRFGADVNAESFSGETVLSMAIRFQRLHVAEYLFSLQTTSSFKGCIYHAVRNDDISALMLLEKNLTADEFNAQLNQNCNEMGVEEESGRHVLHYASKNTLPYLLDKLLKKEVTLTRLLLKWKDRKKSQTALHVAAARDDVDAINIFVEQCCTPPDEIANEKDVNSMTPMMLAADAGHTRCVAALMNACASSLKISDHHDYLPIHAACANGHVEAVRLILNHDASMGIAPVASSGVLPLHLASFSRHLEICQLLVANGGAKWWMSTVRKQTALHYACRSASEEVVAWLLESETPTESLASSIVQKDRDGRTALECVGLSSECCRVTTREMISNAIENALERCRRLSEVRRQHEARAAAQRAEQERENALREEAKKVLLVAEQHGEITRVFALSELQMPGGLGPADIVVARREEYLSEVEFENVFGIKKDAFRKWPEKRREVRKHQLGLQAY